MSTSHLINANIHRAKEGARVLEDIARFLLHDEKLLRQIREIRHRIQLSNPIFDVKQDLGGVELAEKNLRYNLLTLIQANAMRLQEALRVLEEMTKTLAEKQVMKALRYQAYDVHTKLYHAAKKYLKWDLLQGLYLIIDTDVISYSVAEMVEIINQSPINIVQYRHKSASKKLIFTNAYDIKKRLDPGKLFIINDYIDVALDVADGIHVGQNDYALERIRNIIPDEFILGISCHSLQEAQIAMQCQASYIAMGCLFPTKSKADIIPISIHELQKVCQTISLPVCAIGGINIDNLSQVLTAKVSMAALISYVWQTNHPLKTINDMHEKIINTLNLK